MAKRGGAERVPGPEVLLCERCGYVLDGTPREGACAECGKPVAESLPDRRVGSAWQNRPGFMSFLRVVALMHARPSTIWRLIATSRDDNRLMTLNAWLSCFPVFGWFVFKTWEHWYFLSGSIAEGLVELAAMIVFGLGIWSAASLVVVFLSMIEARGVVFFSGKRGWRVPWRQAHAICAHASCTWWTAVVCGLIGYQLSDSLGAWMNSTLPRAWFFVTPSATWIAPIGGIMMGLLVFETLVYQGVRACRFANVPREDVGDSTRPPD